MSADPTPRVQELLDAHDEGPDKFVEVWNRLEATPEDLEGLLLLLTPGVTMEERYRRLDAAANKLFGHGALNPH